MQLRTWLPVSMLALRVAAGPLDSARWIWTPTTGTPPAETVCFRSGLSVTEKSPVTRAELIVTADNLYEAQLNGRAAGASRSEPDAWRQARRFDVTALVSQGWNTLAVEAQNTAPGPAGVIAELVVRHADGTVESLVTDGRWRCSRDESPNRAQPGFDDQAWPLAVDLGPHGMAPWHRLEIAAEAMAPEAPETGGAAPARFATGDRVLFVGRDCSLYRPKRGGNAYDSLTVTIFNPRDSRSFPEHDLPSPMKVGRTLVVVEPARTDAVPRVLFDAGAGALGSPSVSFDGRTILFSMAPAGDAFYHLFRLGAAGGTPEQLTRGAFHDIDPVELPDGRIAFVSTRIGRFEEYHNTPSRSLFTMNADGSDLRALSHTFIFDNEPEVLADGRLLFIRSDNFFDRGKVETTLHAFHPDGQHGLTEFGLDLGPEYGNRLRAYYCGSPAPMPDGRVAFVTGSGVAVARPGTADASLRHLRVAAGDVAAMPDGRLLVTLAEKRSLRQRAGEDDEHGPHVRYESLAVVEPDGTGAPAVFLRSTNGPLHSPVFFGPRVRPPLLTQLPAPTNGPATGVLYCQDVYRTRNTTAGWKHVRAVRVLAGIGLTLRSSHSYIVHAGSEVVELGTVPLASDGSFAVEVPADTAIAFQAVDAEGRSELNGMSWVFVKPGEKRGCVGCHAPRQDAPAVSPGPSLAMRTAPVKLPLAEGLHRFRGNNAAVTGLMELQFDRYREVASLNAHETGVTNLLAWLGSTSAVQRAAAATRLAVFRDPAASASLAACLDDRDREVRLAAAMTLATCGTRDAVPPLCDALVDRDPLVAQAAAVALENLTGTAAPFAAFAEPAARRSAAAGWRARLADWNASTAALAARLDSPDRDERRRAAVALLHTGDASSAPRLRAALERELAVNPLPGWHRGHGGDNARFNAFESVNPRSLQALARLCGSDADVPFLATHAMRLADPASGNLFFTEAAFEALGRIGTPAARSAVREAFLGLKPYYELSRWYGDHDALIACHASPPHFFALRALERDEPANLAPLVPAMLRSVPTDPDRALFPDVDDYEALVGRLVQRAGEGSNVIETCLALLGDPVAKPVPAIEAAVRAVHGAWAGTPDPAIRAAQLLSLVCRDPACEPRVRTAYERHRAAPVDILRVFDTGIPVVKKLPQRHWVCFYLGRALARVGGAQTVDTLIASLRDQPAEAAAGRPDPQGPGVAFLHDDLTPCWRAEAAWALGRLGDARAVPVLEAVVRDERNAPDTRHAAAVALRSLAGPGAAARLAETAGEVSVRDALTGR